MAAYYHGMYLARMVTILAVVAACGGAGKRVHQPGEEFLQDIRFEGADHLSHEGLLSGLALTRAKAQGRPIDDYQLGLDTQRIIGLYQQRGYFSVQVTPRVERKGDATVLIFAVKEGPRATAQVVITGLPPEVRYEAARALVELANGAHFDYEAFDNAKAPMLAMVENAGYAHAQLDATVLADRQKGRATLRYAFDPGPQVRFGPVTISGVDGALADAARERLPVREGELYSTKAIAQAQQAIYGMRRFSSVRVDADRVPDATVLPVKVVLTEATRWEARAGGGAGFDGSTYQARLRGSLTHAGWPTPLTTLGAEFRPAYTVLRENCRYLDVWNCDGYQPRIKLLGWATQQDFVRRDVKADVEGGLDYLKLEAYTTTGARGKVSVGMPLAGQRVHTRVGWQIGYYDFTDPLIDATAQAELHIDKVERLGAFSETVALDLRDNPVSPTFGAYAEMHVTHGGAYAGGAYDYVQLLPELRAYLPLGRNVLAAHARVGVLLGDIVPPTERFYAGGAASQRGFPERRLSPERLGMKSDGTTEPVPIGGAGMIETGVELRTKFVLWGIDMGASVFVDGGDVTETPGELSPGNLHWAIGAGIRPYYLPIGPIRFEIARRINQTNEPLNGELWNFVLSLGEAF